MMHTGPVLMMHTGPVLVPGERGWDCCTRPGYRHMMHTGPFLVPGETGTALVPATSCTLSLSCSQERLRLLCPSWVPIMSRWDYRSLLHHAQWICPGSWDCCAPVLGHITHPSYPPPPPHTHNLHYVHHIFMVSPVLHAITSVRIISFIHELKCTIKAHLPVIL